MVQEVQELIEVFSEFENTVRENIELLKEQQQTMIDGEYDLFEELTFKQEEFDRKLRIIEQRRMTLSDSLCEALSLPEGSSILQIVERLGDEGRDLMISVTQMVEAIQELTFSRANLERMVQFQLSYIDFLQAGMSGTKKMQTYTPAGKSSNLRKTERFLGDG